MEYPNPAFVNGAANLIKNAELVEVAEKMSKDIPFVRVDCYIIDNHVYVGEMTFFSWRGFQSFKTEKWNDYLGSLEKLSGIEIINEKIIKGLKDK